MNLRLSIEEKEKAERDFLLNICYKKWRNCRMLLLILLLSSTLSFIQKRFCVPVEDIFEEKGMHVNVFDKDVSGLRH